MLLIKGGPSRCANEEDITRLLYHLQTQAFIYIYIMSLRLQISTHQCSHHQSSINKLKMLVKGKGHPIADHQGPRGE
jgi:hypothetical protein